MGLQKVYSLHCVKHLSHFIPFHSAFLLALRLLWLWVLFRIYKMILFRMITILLFTFFFVGIVLSHDDNSHDRDMKNEWCIIYVISGIHSDLFFIWTITPLLPSSPNRIFPFVFHSCNHSFIRSFGVSRLCRFACWICFQFALLKVVYQSLFKRISMAPVAMLCLCTFLSWRGIKTISLLWSSFQLAFF